MDVWQRQEPTTTVAARSLDRAREILSVHVVESPTRRNRERPMDDRHEADGVVLARLDERPPNA